MDHVQPTVPEEAVEPEHRTILRKASYVLLTVGLIDIGWTVYRFANSTDSSLSINVVSLVSGLLLLWGGLRAASAIRWLSVAALGVYAGSALAFPVIQPWSLTFVQWRLAPETFFYPLGYYLFSIGLMIWLVFTLGKPAIHAARAVAGRPRRDMRIPAALGFGCALVLLVFTLVMLSGEAADKATAMAEQQAGPNYRYKMLAIQHSPRSVSAAVIAWNDEQVRTIQVRWDKP